jgi:hypothetical protein
VNNVLIPLTPLDLAATPEVPDGDVLLWKDSNGLVVLGAEKDRRTFLDALTPTSTAGAVVASGAAIVASGGDYLRLTAESAQKLKALGEQLDANGSMYGYVRDKGKFAGNLRFDQVNFAPEQALALQTAAASLALRSAIANVEAAVERVEDKIEDVQRHLRAQLSGDVIGTLRHLERVAVATQERGVLLDADWASVAGIRADISRNLERLRDFVVRQASDIDAASRLPQRESKLDDFLEPGGGRDQLNLILVSEHSLHLWEMLRVARVRQTEPQHLESAIADSRRSLVQERRRNEELVSSVMEAVEGLRLVRPLEFYRIFSAREMQQTATAIHSSLEEFAQAARLPLPELGEVVMPTARDARDEARVIARDTAQGVRALGSAAAQGGSSILTRSRGVVRRRARRGDAADEQEA